MKLEGRDGEFVVIGENIHTTRVVLRKGRLVVKNPEGVEAVRYLRHAQEKTTLPRDSRRTSKRRRITRKAESNTSRSPFMRRCPERAPQADDGLAYLHRLVQRQVDAGADYLDLNVDEVSLRLDDQKASMQWLVRAVQAVSPVPLSVDSSNVETIQVGLESLQRKEPGVPLLNSASLERLEALDLARRYHAQG